MDPTPRDLTACLCPNPSSCIYKTNTKPSGTSQQPSGSQKSKSLASRNSTSTSQPPKQVSGSAWKTPLTIKPTTPTTPAISSPPPSTQSSSSSSSAPQPTDTSPSQNKWRPKGKDSKNSPQQSPALSLSGNTSFPSVTLGHTIIDTGTDSVSVDQRLYGQQQPLEINEALLTNDNQQHVDLSSLAADIANNPDLSPSAHDLERHQHQQLHQQHLHQQQQQQHHQQQQQQQQSKKREKKRNRDSILSPFAKVFQPGIIWFTANQQEQQPHMYRTNHTRSNHTNKNNNLLNENYIYQSLSHPNTDSTILSLLSPTLADPSAWSNSALSIPFPTHHQQQYLDHTYAANSSDDDTQPRHQQQQHQQQHHQQQHTQQQQQPQPQPQQQQPREKHERKDSQKGKQLEEKPQQQAQQHTQQQHTQQQQKQPRSRHASENKERQPEKKKGSYRSRENSRTKDDGRKPRTRSTNKEEQKPKSEFKNNKKEREKTDSKSKSSRRPLTRLTPQTQAAHEPVSRTKSDNEKSALHEITQKLATTHAQTQGAQRARDPSNPWGQKRTATASTAATATTQNKNVSSERKRGPRERTESETSKNEEIKQKPSNNKDRSSESKSIPQESEQPRRSTQFTAQSTSTAKTTSSSLPSRPKNNPWGNFAVGKTSIASTLGETKNEDTKGSAPANVYAKTAPLKTPPMVKAVPNRIGPKTSVRNNDRRDDRNNNRDYPKKRDFTKKRDDSRDFPKKRDAPHNRDFPRKPRDGDRDFPRRNNSYQRREGSGRFRSERDGQERRYDREENDGERPYRRYNNRRGSTDDNQDRRPRYRRRDSEDDGRDRRDRGYGYGRRQGEADRTDWRRRGGSVDENDGGRDDGGRDTWEDDRRERRDTRRERNDYDRGSKRESDEAPPVFNPYSSLLEQKRNRTRKATEDSGEEGADDQDDGKQESEPRTNGVDANEKPKERRFALPERDVVEIRPVTDARAVESNDITAIKKSLSTWEKKQQKEIDQQKRSSEQRSGDRGDRRSGRQWGDIMERPRRGPRQYDRDRDDNQNRREEHDQERSSRSNESQKSKIQDIEIGDKELENASSPKRKSSEGSDADHSFDDEPKKGSTDTAEVDKE